MKEGTDLCHSCGAPRSMSRCWRLTCPTNGGTMELVDMLEATERARTQARREFVLL